MPMPARYSAAEIVRLRMEGLSGIEIAARIGCSKSVVYKRLDESGIRIRRDVDLDEVANLYVEHHWSTEKIAAEFGVCRDTVIRRLRAAGAPLRHVRDRVDLASLKPLPRAETYRAHLLGFTWGDCHVGWTTPAHRAIALKTNTTDVEQVRLFRDVLGPFGPVRLGGQTVRATLHASFDYLLQKYERSAPDLGSRPGVAAAFVAGYVDAEGSFGIYDGRGRFKMDTYDADVQHFVAEWAAACGIVVKHHCVSPRGSDRTPMPPRPKDLWRVQVNESLSLLRLAATLSPFLRHGGRRAMMEAVVANVQERLQSRDPSRIDPQLFDHQPRRPRQVDTL